MWIIERSEFPNFQCQTLSETVSFRMNHIQISFFFPSFFFRSRDFYLSKQENVISQCRELHSQTSIHFYCIEVKAQISDMDVSKLGKIKLCIDPLSTDLLSIYPYLHKPEVDVCFMPQCLCLCHTSFGSQMQMFSFLLFSVCRMSPFVAHFFKVTQMTRVVLSASLLILLDH